MTDLFACAPFGRVNVVVDGQAEIATRVRLDAATTISVLGVTRASRPHDPARRRPADRAAGRGDQLASSGTRASAATRPSSARPSRVNNVAGDHRRRHLAGSSPACSSRSASRRTSRCRSRSTRSSTTGTHDRAAATEPADVLVAAGHGPAEAGRRRPRRWRATSRRVFQQTARAGWIRTWSR